MATLVLSQAEVRSLLPMEVCVGLMSDALRELSEGHALNPLRTGMRLPDEGRILASMPGYLEARKALGLKVITVFPGNHGTPYDSHQGIVMLFDVEHGRPLAILDGSEVTAIRTAAASGAATDVLAREDAGDLALIGSGVQARTHLEAISSVRPLRRVRVYSPSAANREAFATRESERHRIPVETMRSAGDAVRGADIICTLTSAHQPVLASEWISAGAHINAVGASMPVSREIDSATMARARVFVDRRESALHESGDYLIPLGEGLIGENHLLGEIGEVLAGGLTGRTAEGDVTLFLSLGVAVEDLAAARYVYDRACAEGVGTKVHLGGVR